MGFLDEYYKVLQEDTSGNTGGSSGKSGFMDEYYQVVGLDKGNAPDKASSYLNFRRNEAALPLSEKIAAGMTVGKKKKKKKEEEEQKLDFFQKGAFEDGFDASDIPKAILGTLGDAGLGVVKGAAGLVEGLVDLVDYGIAGGAELLGHEEYAEDLKKVTQESFVDNLTQGADNWLDQYSVLGRTSDAILQGIGQVGGIMATGGLGASAGMSSAGVSALTTGAMGLSGMGSSMGEAYQSGATDEEALLYGAISGAADALTEMMFGGLGKSVNALGFSKGLSSADDMLAKIVSDKFKNQIAKNFVEFGVKASAEDMEEVVAGIAQAMGKKMTYMSEEEFADILKDENLLEQFIVGTSTSGLIQSGVIPGTKNGSLVEANKNGSDFLTGTTKNEKAVIDRLVADRIAERERNGEKVSKRDRSDIEAEIVSDMEKGFIETETIEEILGGDSVKAYRDLQQEANEYKTLYETESGKLSEKQKDRLAELKEKNKVKSYETALKEARTKISEDVSVRTKGDRLAESYNERARRGQAYEADLSKYDKKQQATIQKAVDSGILNNTRRTHEFVDFVAKIAADTGTTFDFADNAKIKESGFAVEGYTVDGFHDKANKSITVNIDSPKSRRFVVGHEITHALEGSQMYGTLRDTLFEYAKMKKQYDERMEGIRKRYKEGTDFEAELTADLVGEYIFSDVDFVNHLTQNRNLFQRVFDEVKYLCKVATAGSKEARELEKVKRTFEKAYRDAGKDKTEARTEARKEKPKKKPAEKKVSKKTAEKISRVQEMLEQERRRAEERLAKEEAPETVEEKVDQPEETANEPESYEEILEEISSEPVEEVSEETAEEAVEEPVEAPVNEEVAEEPIVEEPIVEEPVAEETVAETVEEKIEELLEEAIAEEKIEALVEEAIAEESVSEEFDEEAFEEKKEAAMEEIASKPIEEIVEAPVEESFEEPDAESIKETIDEILEEMSEEPVEETAEEPAVEETVEEPTEEVAEETVEETDEAPVAEEVVEETAEESAEEDIEAPVAEEVVDENPEPEETVEEEIVEEEPAAEESYEEVLKELSEEPAEEVVEEPAVEEIPEAPVEEPVAEETEQEIVNDDLDAPLEETLVEEENVTEAPVAGEVVEETSASEDVVEEKPVEDTSAHEETAKEKEPPSDKRKTGRELLVERDKFLNSPGVETAMEYDLGGYAYTYFGEIYSTVEDMLDTLGEQAWRIVHDVAENEASAEFYADMRGHESLESLEERRENLRSVSGKAIDEYRAYAEKHGYEKAEEDLPLAHELYVKDAVLKGKIQKIKNESFHRREYGDAVESAKELRSELESRDDPASKLKLQVLEAEYTALKYGTFARRYLAEDVPKAAGRVRKFVECLEDPEFRESVFCYLDFAKKNGELKAIESFPKTSKMILDYHNSLSLLEHTMKYLEKGSRYAEKAAEAVERAKELRRNLAELTGEGVDTYEVPTYEDGTPLFSEDIQYSLTEDQKTIDFLENQEHITVYKAMSLIDGKLYPPMASQNYVTEEYTTKKGEKKTRRVRKLKDPSVLGRWQQAEERPDLIKSFQPPSEKHPDGYGKFDLLKSNGKTTGDVAYNPYEHTSNIVLNDQFSEAYQRPELVTVEYRIPVSELTSGYKAKYAKDAVGLADWKAGGVAQKLKHSHRDVYLTRWSKPVRVLSDAEVAQKYKEILDKETGISVPWNVVTPSLRMELEKIGVPVDHSVVYKGKTFEQAETERQHSVKYSLSDSDGNRPTDEQNARGLDHKGEVEFSLSRDTEYMDKAVNMNQKSMTIDPQAMEETKALRERIAARMKAIKDRGLVGLPEDIEGNTYIANSSYYGSEENTTICPRSLASEAFVDAVSEYLGRPLTVAEQIYISQDLQGRSLTPECTYCYVATDRKAYRAFLGEYVAQRDAVLKDYESGNWDTKTYTEEQITKMSAEQRENSLYVKFLNGRKPTSNMARRFSMWINATKNGKPMIDASHLANISKLMGDINSEFGAELKPQIVDAMKYAQSASWAKKRVNYVAYDGHILKWKQNRIDKLNSHYGLRMYSFSDFHPAFVLENMQMITDASVRGLKMLGYTKDTDFVEIFAPSGMNINVSTFGFNVGDGVFENNLIGAEWEKARALREQYPNVGITFVATNDTLVEWALTQDWIDVVIPFHLVRTGKEVAKAFNYHDYTGESSDTKTEDWKKGDKKYIAPTEHNNDKATYLAALAQNHLKPRFERFLGNPNYMKLVNECRQPASKSQPVQPKFNEDAAMVALAKLEANGYYQPVGGSVDRMYEIAGEVAEAMTSQLAPDMSISEYGEQHTSDSLSALKLETPSAENATVQEKTQLTEENATGVESPVTAEDEKALFPDEGESHELEDLISEEAELRGVMEAYAGVGDIDAVNKLIPEHEAIQARIKELQQPEMERADSLTDADAPPEMDAPIAMSSENYDPFGSTTLADISRSTRSYSDRNPGARNYLEQAALGFLYDVNNSMHGERWYNDQLYYDTGGEKGFGGTKRVTTDDIADLKDTYGYTWDELRKAAERVADGDFRSVAAKRVEYLCHKRLMEGYTDVDGRRYEPDQDYISFLNETFANEQRAGGIDNLLENADQYAPEEIDMEDIAPVLTPETHDTEKEGREAPLYEGAEGQQAMFPEAEPEKPLTRKVLHSNIIESIKTRFKEKGFDFDNVLKKAKNLSTWATVDNTPQRVMEKALGYKEGGVLADITVNQVAQNESEGIKWLNSMVAQIKQISKEYHIKPGSKESKAAQMYAEGFYVNEDNEIIRYGDPELIQDFRNPVVRQNIKKLARDPRIRKIYDDTLARINESRKRNAYPEIPRLDNYFLHFRAMEDTFSRLGLPFNPNDIRAKDLPTDLNGVTADLKPGQPYFASAMHRTGKRTSFDLLGGLEKYLASAKNQIYHIDDIQTLRALRNYIAETYGQATGLEDIDSMTDEEAQQRIEQVYGSHLSTFAKFLNEEANVLAGKTALIDRGLEGIIGRRGITFLNTLNGQVGSNMVGYNASSSLTNFLPVAQTFAKSNKFAFTKAFAQTVANKLSGGKFDSFAEESPVMIRRKGADRFYQTPWQKMANPGYALMGIVDDISTEIIARTKYNEFVRKGMDSQKAHFETDKWVSKLMGDRSLGQQPQLYNSKMLGLVTKFQLEVRNQLDAQFYDTIQETKVSNEHIQNGLARNAKTAAQVASTFAQLAVAQHLYGVAFEAIAGYNPAFDIIEVLMTAFGFDDDEESEDTALDNFTQGLLALAEDMPYASTFTGGRIPISDAIPDVNAILRGEDEYGNEIGIPQALWNNTKEIAPYYLMPAGYGQLKKSVAGLKMFSDDHPIAGSYTDSGNLRFPVEDTLGNRIKAGVFGQYASENARKYFDEEQRTLNPEQTEILAGLDIPIEEYWEYRDNLNKFYDVRDALKEAAYADDATDDDVLRYTYINNVYGNIYDLYDQQKEIASGDGSNKKSELRNLQTQMEQMLYESKFGVDRMKISGAYGEVGSKRYNKDADSGKWYEIKAKNADGSDNWYYQKEQEVTKALGISYEEYWNNREEYNYAYDKPEQYALAQAVGGYTSYRSYSSELYDIKADKDENGKSISGSRKEKVIDYINNLDAGYGEKIILFKSEYNSDDSYNYDIIEYLNSRDDISYAQMESILKYLGFTVDSEGNISW